MLSSLFSKTDRDYTAGAVALKPFFQYESNLSGIEKAIQQRRFSSESRIVLVSVLKKQDNERTLFEKVTENIALLEQENTFTVTTAHQPCLFTGPLYFIYKIFSAINLAEQLKSSFPEYNFVPVYWNGGEDHDFQEVNHFFLNNEKITWNDEQGGSVNYYKTDSLYASLESIKSSLGNRVTDLEQSEAGRVFLKFLNENTTYSNYGEFSENLVHELFGKYGLVVVNPMDSQLKRLSIPLFEKELTEQFSYPLVKQTMVQLEQAGYKNQAEPREINLFYLGENFRERIVKDGDDRYRILNREISFSKKEILAELQSHPEKFSPNVVLRPLYQETILPNIAFVGGGGEIAYWLERKSVFEVVNIPMPPLVRRDSVLLVPAGNVPKMEKLGLELPDFFLPEDALIKKYLSQKSDSSIELNAELEMLKKLMETATQKAKNIDPTLEGAFRAEATKMEKTLEQLASRLVRAEKNKQETQLNQIRNLREQLLPAGNLQERHHNILTYLPRYGDVLFEKLKNELQPLVSELKVLVV